MPITFRPAKRSGVKLMLGLAGPSGCGKTYSALLLAKGIQSVDGGEIFVIDTENRRSEHYADNFDFQIGELNAPFNPNRYLEIIEAAVKAGGKIIIVDSGSHMHEGDGGVLDMHDDILDRLAGKDDGKRKRMNMMAWIEPKRELSRVVNRLLQIDAHTIFCFRAQEKIKPVPGGNPISLGIQPIASDRLSYEMTMRLVLPGDEKGVPDLRAPATKLPEPLHGMLREGCRINDGLGEMLAKWARGDDAKKTAPAPVARAAAPEPEREPETTDHSDQVQPSSSQDAPASEAPSVSSQDGVSRLKLYNDELNGAQDSDDLVARQEGSEHFAKLDPQERGAAREIYRLHLRRIKGDIGRAAFKANVEEILEGVAA